MRYSRKLFGIDPNFREARENLAKATSGNGQIIQIKGTITPVVTISRIGTLYTTVAPVVSVTESIPVPVETTPSSTVEPTATVTKKTTYAPLSPLLVIGAFVGAVILAASVRQNKKI